MGIPKFLSYLKSTYKNDWFLQKKILDNMNKDYDIMILDYQSLIYTAYNIFYNDINYFIRLITKLNMEYNDIYFDLARTIFDKYQYYFLKIFNNNTPTFQSNNLKAFLKAQYNNMDIIISTLADIMVSHTKELSDVHINMYTDMYIYFDGIPSLAKIKEQASRRVYPEIMKELTKKIIDSMDDCIEKQLRHILLPEYPPSIALGSPIINILRDKLKDIFNINKITYGEAEHMIMSDMMANPEKFKDKKILLASPDADLILLCMIMSTRGYNMDIYRENAIMNENFLYETAYDYLFLDKLKQNLGFHNNSITVDICYALLLLGDDFVPIIPGISVRSIPQILSIYNNIIKDNKDFKLVNLDKLNLDNFVLFIKTLAEKLIPEKPRKFIPNIMEKINEFHRMSRQYFIEDFCGKQKSNLNKIKRLYLLNNGYITSNNTNNTSNNIHNKYTSLINTNSITSNQMVRNQIVQNQMISNYLEGCMFIFDLYINNHIKSYSWVYRYETSPSLYDIEKYLDKHNMKTISYVSLNDKYLSVTSYLKYIADYKNMIILDLIHNINKNNKNINNTRTIIDELDIDKMKTKYITYENIKYLFNCNGKMYFNKCLDIIEPISLKDYIM